MPLVSGVVARVRRFTDVHGFLMLSFARRHPYQLAGQLAVSAASIAAQGAVLGAALQFLRQHRTATHDAATAAGSSPVFTILAWGGLLLVLGCVAAWLDTWAGRLSLQLGRRHARELFSNAEDGLAALTAATIPAKQRHAGPSSYLARALAEGEALLMRLWSVVLDAVGQIILVPFAFILLARADLRAAGLLTLLMLAFGAALYWINIRVVDAARALADGRSAESARMGAVASLVVGLRTPHGGELIGRSMATSGPSIALERLLTMRRAVNAMRHPFLAAFLALLLVGIAVASDQGAHVWEKALTVAATVAWISSGLQRVARTVTYMSRILPKVSRLVQLARSERSAREADRGAPPRRWRAPARLAGSLSEAEIPIDGSAAICWASRSRLSSDAVAEAIAAASGRRLSPLAVAIVPRLPAWSSLDETGILSAWGTNETSQARHARWCEMVGDQRGTPDGKTLLGALLTDRSTLLIADAVWRDMPAAGRDTLRSDQRLILQLIEPARPAPADVGMVIVVDDDGLAAIGSREWYESVRPGLKARREAAGVAEENEDDHDFDDEE